MNRLCYAFSRRAGRFVGGMCLRHRAVHPERLWRGDGFVLACTHVGHLEPFVLSGTLRRRVHWLAREEFYRFPPLAWALRAVGAIALDRYGVPARAVRRSIELARSGEIVGIFPEGGRTIGNARVTHGGPIKGGACLIAMRANVPVVPVVVLGVEALHAIEPWLPGRQTPIRTIIGEPIWPPGNVPRRDRRSARRAMTERLRQAFVGLHAELMAVEGGRL